MIQVRAVVVDDRAWILAQDDVGSKATHLADNRFAELERWLQFAIRETQEVHAAQAEDEPGRLLFGLADSNEVGGWDARVVAARVAAGAHQVVHLVALGRQT